MITPTFTANLPISLTNTQARGQSKLVSLPNQEWERYHQAALKAMNEGDHATAEAMWLAALEQAERKGVDKATMAVMFDELSGLYYTRQDFVMAEIFCRRALYSFAAAHDARHPAVAHCLNNLAGICYNMGRLVDAETLCKAAIDILQKSLGTHHAEVGLALHNLAMIYHAQMKFVHAERHYRRALSIRSKSLGNDNQSVINLLDNYASLLEMTNRIDEANALRELARAAGD